MKERLWFMLNNVKSVYRQIGERFLNKGFRCGDQNYMINLTTPQRTAQSPHTVLFSLLLYFSSYVGTLNTCF